MIMDRLRGYAERIERKNRTAVSSENLAQLRNGESGADFDTISDTTTVTLNDPLWSETFTSNSDISAQERVDTPSQPQTIQDNPIIDSILSGLESVHRSLIELIFRTIPHSPSGTNR